LASVQPDFYFVIQSLQENFSLHFLGNSVTWLNARAGIFIAMNIQIIWRVWEANCVYQSLYYSKVGTNSKIL